MLRLRKRRDGMQRRIETETSTLETLRLEIISLTQTVTEEMTSNASLGKELRELERKSR